MAVTINGSTGIEYDDNVKHVLGTGDDLQIYHNGTNSKLTNSTGTLYLEGTTEIWNSAGSEAIAKFTTDGAVELYYDNSKKWETTTNGCKLTGQLDIPDGSGSDGDNHIRIGNNFDLRIYHDGTHSYINNVTGELRCAASQFTVQNAAGNETLLYAVQDAGCGLKHNDNLKLETISTGVNVTGGIRLGGNNAANEMDDYEEGTFTPTLGGNNNIGTYSVSGSGHYIKVGHIVHIQIRFHGVDLDSNADGTVQIAGMPFTGTSASTNPVCAAGTTTNFETYNINFDNSKRPCWYLSNNTSYWQGLQSVSGSSWTNWNVDDFNVQNVLYIDFSGTYRTT